MLASSAALAQDATIQAAQGPVFIRPFGDKKYSKARVGDSMIFGDGVKTGDEAIAHVVLENGTAILLQANSEMTLSGTGDDALADFKLGEFLIGLSRKLQKGQTFRARVPAAVAAVRGTLFWGKTEASKKATFAGFGDKFTVTAQGKTVALGPGEVTSIEFGQAPEKPKPHEIPKGYLKTFAVGDALQDLDKLVDPKIK